MATIVDQRSSHPLGGYYDQEYQRFQSQPNFTNPWGVNASNQHLFGAQHAPTSEPYASRPQYTAPPAASLTTAEPINRSRSFAPEYSTSAPTSQPTYAPTSGERYPSEQYPSSYSNYEARYASQYQQPAQRRPSYGLKSTDSFNDALDAGRGMVAMSQQDFAPRTVYQPRNNSTDSYGFPSGHSDSGSVSSSSSSYPYYSSYSASVDGSVAGSSVTDYSSTSEELGQRTLPPPGQIINGFPPDATQMMTQFNSKLAANAQKKHKCKICDKRFTRPSSLQTHMYSHTGEKPFACDFEGCGRHFSVVSNLRRHKKCHKSGFEGPDSPASQAASEE